MIELYAAAHGEYPKGIVSALNLLIGDIHGITPICAYCGEISSRAELEEKFESLVTAAEAKGHEVVIFTDLLGGSVNNSAVNVLVRHNNVHVVTGMNLIMLMAYTMSEENTVIEKIKDAISSSSESMVYMNHLEEIINIKKLTASENTCKESENDFF